MAQRIERRQVRQYEAEYRQCPSYQWLTCAPFSKGVSAPVRYGSRPLALAVYLTTQQILPRRCTKEVLTDLLGVAVTRGTLTTLIKRAAGHL